MPLPDDKWLTLSQAAEVLGVHPTTLRRWADRGDIPVRLTPGRHRRFRASEIQQHLEQQSRHGSVSSTGASPAQTLPALDTTGRVWADFALVETRQRLFNQPEPQWLMAFDKDDRDEKRELGRRLMALLMQHISAPDDDRSLLIEARSIATRYAQNCLMVGLSASESLEATTFFRDAMTEVALQMPHVAQLDSDAQLRLLRKLNQIFNVVQVSLIEYFDETSASAHNDHK